MTIKFYCECGQKVSATPDMIGTEATCPGCEASLTVPDASDDVAAVPLPPEMPSHPEPHLIIESLPPSAPERGRMGLILGLIAVVLVTLGAVLWMKRDWFKKGGDVKILASSTTQRVDYVSPALQALNGGKPLYEILPDKKDTTVFVALDVQMPMSAWVQGGQASRMMINGQTFEPVALKEIEMGPLGTLEKQIAANKVADYGKPAPFRFLPPKWKPTDPAVVSFLYAVPKELIPTEKATFACHERSVVFPIR